MIFKIPLLLLLIPLVSFAGGKEIYQENCEKCHGFSQQGSLGLPLYQSTIDNYSDSYLSKTIKLGRPGRVMPGFNLSDQQIRKLIAYLRAGEAAPTYSEEKIQGDIGAGKYTYDQYCQRCHGSDLEGGQGVGKNYSWQKTRKVSPPALANPGFLHAASDHMIKHVIINGIQDSEMPAFGKDFNFSEKTVHDLVAYIRSYQKPLETHQISDEPLVLVYNSAHDLSTTVDKLRESAAAYNFRVYPSRTLLEGLGNESEGDSKQVVIRFCNFENMQKFLKLDPRLGVVLPCRATVVENNDGKVDIIIENYKRAVERFNNAQLIEGADELIQNMNEMIEEAIW